MEALNELISRHGPALVVFGLALAAGGFLWPMIVSKSHYYKFPLLDKTLDYENPEEVYKEGYKKFRHDIHRISTPDGKRHCLDGDIQYIPR